MGLVYGKYIFKVFVFNINSNSGWGQLSSLNTAPNILQEAQVSLSIRFHLN